MFSGRVVTELVLERTSSVAKTFLNYPPQLIETAIQQVVIP
jgi:hypothetical protein